MNNEFKALNIGTNTEGGYLAPIAMIREIIKGVTEMSPVRSVARVRTISTKSIDLPIRRGQFAAQWVGELGTSSESTGLEYGIETITAHQIVAMIDLTNEMYEDSVFDMVGEINSESTEQFALAEGAAFVNGDGIKKPMGIMAGS